MKGIRRTFVMASALGLLAACGGGGGGATSSTPGTGGAQGPSVGDALMALQDSGQLPSLDRSPIVAGTDLNADGIRDDVETFVDALPDTDPQKDLLRAFARAIQDATELGQGAPDTATVRATSVAIVTAMQCVRGTLPAGLAQHRIDTIRNITVNTPERFAAYVHFDELAAGLAVRPPATPDCDLVAAGSPKQGLGRGTVTDSICENRGYVVLFFNGVWNTLTQANEGLAALKDLIGDTFNDEPVQYETMYNHTGSTVDATFMQDIAEVFIQRANEVDASGGLADRFEFLWEILMDGERSFWDTLIDAVPAAGALLDQLWEEIITRSVAGWSLLLSNPPTISDYDEHRARLDEFALQGQKLLMVAHSQGNLFMNAAYDYIAPKVDPGSVAAAHIAPASTTLRGPHLLANIDLVINGLRTQGVGSVPPTNLDLSLSLSDPSGHTLIGTYLDGSRPGRAAVAAMLNGAMQGLVTPMAAASSGFFTVTLTWNGTGDVDLHTFEPDGTHVFYASSTGNSGYLDVDNVVADGPEHYYATCDPMLLQTGTYSVGINNYNNATGRTATLQVATARDGVLITRSLDVGPERGSSGNGSPIPVFTISVSVDGDGIYTVTAQ